MFTHCRTLESDNGLYQWFSAESYMIMIMSAKLFRIGKSKDYVFLTFFNE